MGNNFSSKYELFRNVKADDKKGLNRNYGIFLVLRRKTGIFRQSGVCAAGRRQADLDFLEREGTQVWGKEIEDIRNIKI